MRINEIEQVYELVFKSVLLKLPSSFKPEIPKVKDITEGLGYYYIWIIYDDLIRLKFSITYNCSNHMVTYQTIYNNTVSRHFIDNFNEIIEDLSEKMNYKYDEAYLECVEDMKVKEFLSEKLNKLSK